jgi:hypothetical protein
MAASLMAAGVLISISPPRALANGCLDVAGQKLTVGEVLLNEPVCTPPSASGITVKVEGSSSGFFANNAGLGMLGSSDHKRVLMVKLKETRTDRCFKGTVHYVLNWTPAATGSINCGGSGFTGSDERVLAIDTCAAGNGATLAGMRELGFVALGPSTFIDKVSVTTSTGTVCSSAVSVSGCSKVWQAGCVNCC